MQKFDAIRPFYDSEINEVYTEVNHPMMKALMNFTFLWMKFGKNNFEKRILFVIFNVILFTNRFKSTEKKVLMV
jgi:hypothetical protein